MACISVAAIFQASDRFALIGRMKLSGVRGPSSIVAPDEAAGLGPAISVRTPVMVVRDRVRSNLDSPVEFRIGVCASCDLEFRPRLFRQG